MTVSKMQSVRQDIVEKMIAQLEKKVFKQYVSTKKSVLEVIKDTYARYLTDVPQADYYTTLSLYNRLKTLGQDLKGIYVKLDRELIKTVKDGQMEIFEEAYYRDGYTMSFFTDKQVNPLNNLVNEFSVTGDMEKLKEIKDKALKRIAEKMIPPSGNTLTQMLVDNDTKSLNRLITVIKQGLVNGESYDKQVKRVAKVFNGNASNAARVIRTEGNRNMNAGSFFVSEDLKEQGVKIKRQWVATKDSRTRDSHQALDGQFEDDDGYFWIGSDKGRYPTDFTEPENSINCRCTTIDIVEGTTPQVMRARNPVTGKTDIVSYKTYEEWKKSIK